VKQFCQFEAQIAQEGACPFYFDTHHCESKYVNKEISFIYFSEMLDNH